MVFGQYGENLMDSENEVSESHDHILLGLLVGLLVGGLSGAITMLLWAPRSGRETRKQIKKKGLELRDRTTEMVEDGITQVRRTADRVTIDGREKIEDLKQQGQDLAAEQLDRVSAAARAGKKAIQGNHN
jgi:gas vesicle protein